MALVSTPTGIWFPAHPSFYGGSLFTGNSLLAAGAGVAYVGRIYIDGRPSSPKTLSAAGGGKVAMSNNGATFANAGTSVDFGLQGVDLVGGSARPHPDGTFTVKKTLVGGTDTVSSNALNEYTMTSGTVSLSHGDLVSIVMIMTARAGADSILNNAFQANTLQSSIGFPVCVVTTNSGSTWTVPSDLFPGAHLLTFDDGTTGTFQGDPTMPALFNLNGATVETWQDSTNPDERGIIFQLPWDCKIDAIGGRLEPTASTGDFTIKLYSDPLGVGLGPTALFTETITAKGNFQFYNSSSPWIHTLATEQSLSKNTDYCLAFKGTGASTFFIEVRTLYNTNHRKFLPGGTTVYKATRNNGSGNFTAESPAITMYRVGVRISALPDSAGGGSQICGGTIVR